MMDDTTNSDATLLDVEDGFTKEAGNEVLIKYVQEKDNLQRELAHKEKEIQRYKARVYDLDEEVKSLKSDLRTAQESLSKIRELPLNGGNSRVPSNKLGVVRPSTARRSPMVQRAKSAKTRAAKAPPTPKKDSPEPAQITAAAASEPGTVSPQDVSKGNEAIKRLAHYEEVAAKFPELKLSVILKSEEFFNKGDINNDGTIDEKELEQLLMRQGQLYTDKELKEIMSQIDVDKTGTIDIMEYLAVMDRVQQRKRVNLPPALTRSTTCLIQ